jgi:hypothetical protein
MRAVLLHSTSAHDALAILQSGVLDPSAQTNRDYRDVPRAPGVFFNYLTGAIATQFSGLKVRDQLWWSVGACFVMNARPVLAGKHGLYRCAGCIHDPAYPQLSSTRALRLHISKASGEYCFTHEVVAFDRVPLLTARSKNCQAVIVFGVRSKTLEKVCVDSNIPMIKLHSDVSLVELWQAIQHIVKKNRKSQQ